MQTIGRALTTHLKQNNTMPKLFQVFPGEGKCSNTEQYVAHNFLGYSFLNSAYVATYKDSSVFKVFLMELPTPEKAHAVLSEYFKAVPKEAVTQIASDTYQIHDTNNGAIRLQVLDRYLCGIMNDANNKSRDQVLQKLKSNLLK